MNNPGHIKHMLLFTFIIGMNSIGVHVFQDARSASPIEIAHELQRKGVDHWQIVTAQAITESGWRLNSRLFQQTGNFCGMRRAGQRPSTRNGLVDNYASFMHWKDCVQDIKFWQKQNWRGDSREDYFKALSRWASDTAYLDIVKAVLKRIDQSPEYQLPFNYQNRFNFALVKDDYGN